MPHADADLPSSALELRAAVYAAVRRFFALHAYLEVETPIRIPAPLPEVHIDAQPSGKWFLQTSPEACMKRLLAAGLPRIFQICKCFRQGERGSRHLPELTMLEWYTAQADYGHMMTQCEALIGFIAQAVVAGLDMSYRKHMIDLRPPWQRLAVADAFKKYGGMSMEEALRADRFDEVMGIEIEPHLGWTHPVFIYDYPAQCGALARTKPGNPQLVERFELYIGGIELCNAFSELTDPEEQRRRFEQEAVQRYENGKTVYPSPDRFLDDLALMPEATGNALGLDRLIMLFADAETIDEVVAFTPEQL